MNFFREKVLEKKNKSGILAYFKDSICIPEISVLLMMVDDSVKNPRKKRETLLNPNYKYIGISSSDSNSNYINVSDININGIDNKENNKEKDTNGINNNINSGNNIWENNDVNKNNNGIKDENNNNINKSVKNEIKHKPFCAYFTLK